MQTLTTAMGPLMVPENHLCLRSQMSHKQWSKYIKGASAIFACYIARGKKAIVLSPPPPEKLHPSGLTNYQLTEEPLLKGKVGGKAVLRIEMVHPTVKGAEEFCYQIWPINETSTWVRKFGMQVQRQRHCRTVNGKLDGKEIGQLVKFLTPYYYYYYYY